MAIMVRLATRQDTKVWAAMRFELWPHTSLRELTRELTELLKRRRFRGWIAEDAGKPVGFAEIYVRDFANGCNGQPVVFLEGIWVKKGFRRKGIGKALIHALKTWAAKKGFKELGSDTGVENRLSQLCQLRPELLGRPEQRILGGLFRCVQHLSDGPEP